MVYYLYYHKGGKLIEAILKTILNKLESLDRIERDIQGIKGEIQGINKRLDKIELNQEQSKKNMEVMVEVIQTNQESEKQKIYLDYRM